MKPRSRNGVTLLAIPTIVSSPRSSRRAGRRRSAASSVPDAIGGGADAWPGGRVARLRRAGRRSQRRWNAPGVTMRTRQRLLRALVTDIIADVDEAVREVVLTIHWRGGQHSQLRVRKPKSGEHGCRTPEEALAVMRSMATRWSDEDIAASLNRMGMPTGQGKTWTAHRVSSLRRVHGIHAYRSAEKNGEWLTMSEAATALGVTHHRIRRLIKDGVLAAEQVVPGAPYQIRATDLHDERVTAAIGRTGRPCRVDHETNSNVYRHLKKGSTMNAASRSAGCSLDGVRVQLEPAVLEEQHQARPIPLVRSGWPGPAQLAPRPAPA